VLRDDAWGARHICINSDTGNPCQPLAGKNEGPGVSLFAGHARVDEDVLELACPAASARTHREAWCAKAKAKIQTQVEVSSVAIATPRTARDFETRARPVLPDPGGFGGHDLHGLPHDTQPQAAR
jgi:hypothetical protein